MEHRSSGSPSTRRSLQHVQDSSGDYQVQLANAVFHNDYEAVYQLVAEQGVRPSHSRAANPLTMAAADGRDRIMALLIDHGWDPEEPDRTDFMWFRRPIHIAASRGHVDCLNILLDRGVNVNSCDHDHRTALHWTSTYGRAEAAHLLIARGAAINMSQADGFTPLHAACCLGHNTVCQVLIAAGADVNLSDRDQWSALHTAACYGYREVVTSLLDAGALVNQLTSDRETAFHVACSGGHVDIVQILFQHGADIDVANGKGYTAFHLSVFYHKYNVACYLISINANINTACNTSQTPFQLAVFHCEERFVKLLLAAGCHVTDETLASIVPWSHELNQEIHFLATNPRSLKQLCCFRIRDIFRCTLCDNIGILPIPQALKDYIMLKHLDTSV